MCKASWQQLAVLLLICRVKPSEAGRQAGPVRCVHQVQLVPSEVEDDFFLGLQWSVMLQPPDDVAVQTIEAQLCQPSSEPAGTGECQCMVACTTICYVCIIQNSPWVSCKVLVLCGVYTTLTVAAPCLVRGGSCTCWEQHFLAAGSLGSGAAVLPDRKV